MTILLKRVYELPSVEDGKRILVDKLWLRGLKKEDAKIDEWAKDVAPSNGLRIWYGHDPDRWNEFRIRYWKELDAKRGVVENLAEESKERRVTFVFGAKETKLNNANVLKEYIENIFK